MKGSFVGVTVGLLVLTAIFTPIEWAFAAVRGRPWLRRGLGTDVAYWFVTGLLTKAAARAAVIVTVVALAVLAGVAPQREAIQAHFAGGGSIVQRQPLWLQALEVLLIGDLVG